MNIVRATTLAALAVAASMTLAHAQTGVPGHQGFTARPSTMQDGAGTPMGQAMRRGQQSMMQAPMTGDSDRDFATLMIQHHQSAIDMARAELNQGNDPEMRKLAENIIQAQENEIKEMEAWLQKNPAK